MFHSKNNLCKNKKLKCVISYKINGDGFCPCPLAVHEQASPKEEGWVYLGYQSANSFARWTVLVSQPHPSLFFCQQDAVEVISMKDFSLCNQHVFLLQMQPQLKCSQANKGQRKRTKNVLFCCDVRIPALLTQTSNYI